MLERMDPKLAPPRISHAINHSGEIVVPVREMSDDERR